MSDDEGLSRQQFLDIIQSKKKPLFVKFTATWCGPCKKVKPMVDAFLTEEMKAKLTYLEIDIDDSIDVYAFMKSKRMLKSIPTLLYYDMQCKSFAPTLSISDSNENVVNSFLDIIKMAHK